MLLPRNTMAAGRGGQLHLGVERVAGESAVTRASATSPLKLLTPRPRGSSAWAYVSSYGGGMVAGDQHQLAVQIGPGATGFFGTQSSTKVYRSPDGQLCQQSARVKVAAGGLLVWLPDPVQAFAGARYRQDQEFRLEGSSGLVLLDGFTGGRSERGEHWAFEEYGSRTEVFVGGTRRLLDSVCLSSENSKLTVNRRMGACQAMSLLLLLGPPLQEVANGILGRIACLPATRGAAVRVSTSPVAGGALVRVAGVQVEAVRRQIAELLSFLPRLLGDDPLARKW